MQYPLKHVIQYPSNNVIQSWKYSTGSCYCCPNIPLVFVLWSVRSWFKTGKCDTVDHIGLWHNTLIPNTGQDGMSHFIWNLYTLCWRFTEVLSQRGLQLQMDWHIKQLYLKATPPLYNTLVQSTTEGVDILSRSVMQASPLKIYYSPCWWLTRPPS